MIKVYTLQNCTWCHKAKVWLQQNKISYQELDTTEVDKYREDLIFKTGQLAVPTFEIDNKTIIGFNERTLRSSLRSA